MHEILPRLRFLPGSLCKCIRLKSSGKYSFSFGRILLFVELYMEQCALSSATCSWCTFNISVMTFTTFNFVSGFPR